MTAAPTPPRSVTVRAPAKVNLELRVGALRPDGYHDLATVFQAVSLYDEVSVARWDEWQVIPGGTYADHVPTGNGNLAIRAAKLLSEQWDIDDVLSIRIDKDIPVAGGMAGGSADAAAALLACDHLWGLGLERDELVELAAELGSDVPFPLAGGEAPGAGALRRAGACRSQVGGRGSVEAEQVGQAEGAEAAAGAEQHLATGKAGGGDDVWHGVGVRRRRPRAKAQS